MPFNIKFFNNEVENLNNLSLKQVKKNLANTLKVLLDTLYNMYNLDNRTLTAADYHNMQELLREINNIKYIAYRLNKNNFLLADEMLNENKTPLIPRN